MNATPIYGNTKPHDRPVSDTVLDQWLKARGVSRFAFARQIGCDPKMVNLWANNQAMPSLIYAFKIEKESGGGVPVSSWLGTELGKMLWRSMGADWDSLEEQRKAERLRRKARQ